jgi:hypothetical protein
MSNEERLGRKKKGRNIKMKECDICHLYGRNAGEGRVLVDLAT